MRAKSRQQGRFASLGCLRKVPGTPESRYPLIIVDEKGLPVFYLCEWYRRRKEHDSGRTSDTYLDMLLPFASFLTRRCYAWDAEPERIHVYVMEFLRDDLGCQVHPDERRGDGYLVETTGQTPLSKSSLGVLIAALTSFYQVMSTSGYYRYPDPLHSAQLMALKQEHLLHVANAGSPDHAGIRGEPRAALRDHSTGFLRQYRGKVWEPQLTMKPEAVQQSMRDAVDWMIQHAPTLRDQVVLQLLRTTGARLSEILALTAGGYRNARHACQAFVTNKGSKGREEKRIYFTNSIEKTLMHYIRTERAEHDQHGHCRFDQLDDADPIFLTRAGMPYTRPAFYFHWRRLFQLVRRRYHLEFSPHDIRHLHVTKNLLRIKQKAQGDKDLEADLKEGFREIMGWRSAETMEIYTHTLRKREILLNIMLSEDEASWNETPLFAPQTASRIDANPSHLPGVPPDLATGDDLSWYEE